MQNGTIAAITTVRHPPEGFPDEPRVVGLITLDGGDCVIGRITGASPSIGSRVIPRVSMERVTGQKLRAYDVVYEVAAPAPVREDPFVFEGYILALTGPSGVGKSTVSKVLSTALSSLVTRVPILTTREPKDGDDGEYLYVSREEFIRLEDAGALAASTRIPAVSEDRRYGYRTEDITRIWQEGLIPLVVTEMHLLQGLAHTFGRRSILSCGLLPPGTSRRAMLSQLLHRLRSRGRDSEQSIADRVRNASADLDFFRSRKELFDHMLVNDDIDAVIATLKNHVLNTQDKTV
jgi:guanylate kinase